MSNQVIINGDPIDLDTVIKVNVDQKKTYDFAKGETNFYVFKLKFENGNSITAKVKEIYKAKNIHQTIAEYFATSQKVDKENDDES